MMIPARASLWLRGNTVMESTADLSSEGYSPVSKEEADRILAELNQRHERQLEINRKVMDEAERVAASLRIAEIAELLGVDTERAQRLSELLS